MVGLSNTVRVSGPRLDCSESWQGHRLVGDLDGVLHGVQLGHGSFRELAVLAGFPLVVLLDRDLPGKTQQGRSVGEHADDGGARCDPLVNPFYRVRRLYLAPVKLGESGEGEQIRLGVSEYRGDFRVGVAEHRGDLGELFLNALRIGLGEDRSDA